MINFLLGAPGGGKSYEACVFHVLPALVKGRKVITNLPLNVAAFEAIDPAFGALIELRTKTLAVRPEGPAGEKFVARAFANPEDYADTWRHAAGFGPLYIIDECHFCLPARATSVLVEEWFSMARHHNVDVLLISQSYGKVSQAIRDLVQIVYRVRKNIALGSPSSYTRKVQDGLRGEVVNTSIRRYHSQYFQLYQSHTQGQAVEEFNAADVRPLWKHWTFIGAAACLVLAVGIVAFGDLSVPWAAKPGAAPSAKRPEARPALVSSPVAVPASAVQLVDAKPGAFASAASSVQGVLSPGGNPAEPFGRMGVHLLGSMRMGHREVWSFMLSQNGQPGASITERELLAAGYTWEGDSHCSGLLSFGQDVRRRIVCDSPRVGQGVANVGGAQ